uniref:Secretory protein n=1 Tax=Chilobrachys guangxiensis TaxID=278060 RepID=B1P1K1_CHIGU|nr:secretory protein [Chilobrachys guangxiensis]
MNVQRTMLLWISLFVLNSVTKVVLSKSCDDEKLHKCLKKVHLLLDSQWKRFSRNTDDLKDYCDNLKNDADCVKELPDDCEKKHKDVNILKPSIKKFKGRFCKDDASEIKLFKDQIPCLVQNDPLFASCEPKESRSSFNVTDKKYCKDEMNFIKCFGDKADSFCKKGGRKLWEYLQEPNIDLIKTYCSGTGILMMNLATVSVFVIVTLLQSVF